VFRRPAFPASSALRALPCELAGSVLCFPMAAGRQGRMRSYLRLLKVGQIQAPSHHSGREAVSWAKFLAGLSKAGLSGEGTECPGGLDGQQVSIPAPVARADPRSVRTDGQTLDAPERRKDDMADSS
jgi:hypothetical protein